MGPLARHPHLTPLHARGIMGGPVHVHYITGGQILSLCDVRDWLGVGWDELISFPYSSMAQPPTPAAAEALLSGRPRPPLCARPLECLDDPQAKVLSGGWVPW